jgi:peptidyl-prolyl cis-trans isomerase C
MKHSPLTLFAFAAIAMLAATPVFAKKATPAGGTVNGKPIPQNIVDFIVDVSKSRGQPDSPELRKRAREIVVNQQLLIQEAQKQGLDGKSAIKAQMELARQDVLIKAYLDGYMKSHPISDDDTKKAFDTLKTRMGDKEYKVRHVLVESEDDAKAIIAKLKKGDKFDTLTAQSKDTGSKDKGGDLGWAAATNYVPAFSDAVTKLNKGQYTETPVKTQYGWHVIQLDDTRALPPPSFDEVKPQIEQGLQQQIVERHLKELRAAANVE